MNFFAYLNRMKYIERWSLMRSSEKENVAEHSHNVAMIAHALGVIDNTVFGGDSNPERLATLAVFHEAGEVLTGDLPTPIKYYNPAIREAYRAIEATAEEKLLRMLPEEMRAAYAPLVCGEMTERERRMLKAADKLSALVKCKEELKSGNREFARAEESVSAALDELAVPAADYFRERFLPAFSLTLDEMEE